MIRWSRLLLCVSGLWLSSTINFAQADHSVPDQGLLGCWQFEEGSGLYSVNTAEPFAEAELHNVSWVQGEFGTALRFSGTDSYVTVPSLTELNGSDEMTLAAWVYWEGTGQYPNIFTGGSWSPGGFMFFVRDQSCSFRMGKPGHRHGVAGEQWQETSAPLLNKLPMKRWVHLTAVFKRPEITTYVDGEKVGSAKWDFPVGQQGDMQVGRWAGSDSHQGLIDDVRIYERALAGDEVQTLADPTGRTSSQYNDLGPAVSDASELVSLETRWATMQIGDDGTILSLTEKGSGRELISQVQPMVSVQLASGQRLQTRRMRIQDNLLIAEFPRDAGTVSMSVQAKDDYFVFQPVGIDIAGVERLTFLQLTAEPRQYVGSMAGLASDEQSGVCVRSLALEVGVSLAGRPVRMQATSTAEHGLVHNGGDDHLGAALAVGPREQLIPMLRSMAKNEAVPRSDFGGPWAMDAEQTRGSYLFANLAAKDTDAWIDLARRGGFTNIHLHGWWQSLGHYQPRQAYFPNGLSDMKATAERIRAAGLFPGIHTLTACISTNDSWVTPQASSDLIASHQYTLVEPLSATDTTIRVKEIPAEDQGLIWSYSGKGNALRLGHELVRYSEISRTPPYAFLKCERGAFGTQAVAHPPDTAADYLQQRYLAFYPEPDSELADQLADRIAEVYNECGLQMIYFDGSEGMGSRYGVDTMRWKIFERLNGAVTEASQWGHNSWWFHSRLGAWDHPVWAMKQFHDAHIASASRFRKNNLLVPQLGWWAPRGPSKIARGHFPDEMEYFAAKNLSIDGPMSIQGVQATGEPANARMEEQLTILGWYERLRLARYFDEPTISRLQTPGGEVRLRQNDDGLWKFTSANYAKHRFVPGNEQQETENPFAAQPLRVRLEALYDATPYKDSNATVLADFANLDSWDNRRDASGVTSQVTVETEDVRAGGRSLRFSATNSGETSRGAWSQIGTTYSHPYFSMAPGDAIGVWVKGDGSGALLNIQLRTPSEYHGSTSDHYVDLDFTGWRYVELLLRERDAERSTDYVWPYAVGGGSHAVYRNAIDTSHLSEINVYLNEIPAKGKVDILLSPLHSLVSRKVEIVNPGLRLGRQRITFPVSMQSGQYLEMESLDDCILYDERGAVIRHLSPQTESMPTLSKGSNSLQFSSTSSAGTRARAEVTVISLGPSFGTRRDDSAINWEHLDREYDLPHMITRLDGAENVWKVVRRSGGPKGQASHAPKLEIEIEVEKVGNAKTASSNEGAFLDTPSLTIGETTVRFPVQLTAGQRLLYRGETGWQVLGTDGEEVAAGSLEQPLPTLAPGKNRVSLDLANGSSIEPRLLVKTTKVY